MEHRTFVYTKNQFLNFDVGKLSQKSKSKNGELYSHNKIENATFCLLLGNTSSRMVSVRLICFLVELSNFSESKSNRQCTDTSPSLDNRNNRSEHSNIPWKRSNTGHAYNNGKKMRDNSRNESIVSPSDGTQS